jgi:hypothetical protein
MHHDESFLTQQRSRREEVPYKSSKCGSRCIARDLPLKSLRSETTLEAKQSLFSLRNRKMKRNLKKKILRLFASVDITPLLLHTNVA